MKPRSFDSFLFRIAGKISSCEDCGCKLYHQLPPRDGVSRYGCNDCGAAYLLPNPSPPKLLEN